MDFNRLTFFLKMFIEKEENLLELREIKFDKDNTIVPAAGTGIKLLNLSYLKQVL